ncbi:hypothetical protein RRG08_034186 [Elysia crispata]|uniref:Uncharacterized protein n=1 Tax=Elysia crispata TaxID=231223 RepID=A0AAE1B9S6_9GAST|nr:hypothetical protein RRG08_034186 [Elysia crispata]
MIINSDHKSQRCSLTHETYPQALKCINVLATSRPFYVRKGFGAFPLFTDLAAARGSLTISDCHHSAYYLALLSWPGDPRARRTRGQNLRMA